MKKKGILSLLVVLSLISCAEVTKEGVGSVAGGVAISTIVVGALLAASTGVVGASVVAMGVQWGRNGGAMGAQWVQAAVNIRPIPQACARKNVPRGARVRVNFN